jgi:hypothetical protein
MNKKKVGTALVAILLLGGLAWALVPRGPDPQVAKVLAMQEKLFNEKGPREGRREAFDELRKEAEKLTPDQRMKMMHDNPPPFVKEFQKNVRDYFELPEDKKKAALDKQIDAMEKMRKDMEKRFANNKGKGGPRGPGGFGGPPGGGPPGGGPPGGGDRNEMRKRMLDNTSATDRAMFSEYFSAVEKRRQERGLPQMGGPRF